VAARTELQRRVLEYMRGIRPVINYEDPAISKSLDQLVQRGDLKVFSPIIGRTFEYRLTEQGRHDDEPPELEPTPVDPKLPPLSPGGAIMLEVLQQGSSVTLSELQELIEKGYLTPDNLKELTNG